jgi:hypothetical protein
MFRRFRFVALALMVLAFVVPAAAAERVESLPEIKPSMSGRFELALVLNDQPFVVGKGAVESPTRAYFVLKALPVEGMREATLEVVIFDGKMYLRQDADPQWYVTDMADLPASAPEDVSAAEPVDVEEGVLSRIGEKPIAGTPTDQYQLWINDEDPQTTDHVALDFFIGKQVNYLYQYQVRIAGNDPDLGELKLETVTRLFDFDDPTIIVRPPANAESIDMTSRGLMAPLKNAGLLGTLSAPFATSQLRDMAVERFGR